MKLIYHSGNAIASDNRAAGTGTCVLVVFFTHGLGVLEKCILLHKACAYGMFFKVGIMGKLSRTYLKKISPSTVPYKSKIYLNPDNFRITGLLLGESKTVLCPVMRHAFRLGMKMYSQNNLFL
jgi:hypothetical protein